MLFPYQEHGLVGNLLGLTLLFVINIITYFIIRPLLHNFIEKRRGPIDPETDIPFEEYWKEELATNQ